MVGLWGSLAAKNPLKSLCGIIVVRELEAVEFCQFLLPNVKTFLKSKNKRLSGNHLGFRVQIL